MQPSVAAHLLFVGTTPASQALLDDIQSAARTHAKVLILGETGVGKELVAQLIHARSARRLQPFVALNCSGIPETLLESELFGHMRGSFTGAYRDKPGLARQADNGTLFLDELGEMSLRMQAVLLRFAETGEIQPIGADRSTERTDVRLIGATNRDLKARVASQEFREDLFYRLNVIQICVPPLRERRDDIPALLDTFLERASLQHGLAAPTLTAETRECLREYSWPGNIRELKNVVERLVVRGVERAVQVDDLPDEVRSAFVRARLRAPSPPVGELGGDVAGQTAPSEPTPDRLWRRLQSGETFWSAVAEPFRNHDLTRADVHALVRRGLDVTQGSYRALLKIFNLPEDDYKRVLSFLRQHDCHVPFQRFRRVKADGASADPRHRRSAAG
jgi:transcriptional regulator with GAF, ATPase, and Fis domain